MNDNTCNADDISENTCNVDDLRALKRLLVKGVLQRSRKYDSEIEAICAVSPDSAIMRLSQESEWVAKTIALVEQADKAMRDLAYKLDADSSIAQQVKSDPYFHGAEEERRAALDILLRFATRGDGQLTGEAEEEKNAALQVLVPTMDGKRAGTTRAVTQDPAAPLDEFPF